MRPRAMHPFHQLIIMWTIGSIIGWHSPITRPPSSSDIKWTPTTITPRFCICARLRLSNPFNIKPFTYATVGPEPCHAGFYQRHAERKFSAIIFAFFRRMLRETKFRALRAIVSEWSRHCANTRAEKAENRIRKLYPKPEYTKPKPCEPVRGCRNSRENLHCGNIVTFCRYELLYRRRFHVDSGYSIGWAIMYDNGSCKECKD